MKRIIMMVLALSALNGFSQDISFFISSNDHEYSLPVDTAFRQVMLTSSSLDLPHEDFFYPDSISLRFPVSEDTVCYTMVGLRTGTFWMDSGTSIPSQINPYSEIDSIHSVTLEFPFDTLVGITYIDLPGDSISGFDLLLLYEGYLFEVTWICFWLLSENQSNWLNFQPLGVGNIWKFDVDGESAVDERWEIFDSLATEDTTYYYVQFQTEPSGGYGVTEVDTSVVYTTALNPYKVARSSGGWCGIIADFSPRIETYPSFSHTLLPKGNGSMDFGYYNPGFVGQDLSTYGIGFSYASGCNAYQRRLSGFKIGSEIVGDIGTLVSVDEEAHLPVNCFIGNYPNPFNPSTTITYDLPEQSDVSLIIYDVAGREVKSLVSTTQSPGSYQVRWEGTNKDGQTVSAGLYFARLQASDYSSVGKMVYLQ
ncbi:MAG: T9SS type A sorting domain-containing protein [Candidatus Marinimicrobia bacterium]|nr:T9SS type A sorting domain-containing protein [Candidatus Neomarinimicrobiota bacterium]